MRQVRLDTPVHPRHDSCEVPTRVEGHGGAGAPPQVCCPVGPPRVGQRQQPAGASGCPFSLERQPHVQLLHPLVSAVRPQRMSVSSSHQQLARRPQSHRAVRAGTEGKQLGGDGSTCISPTRKHEGSEALGIWSVDVPAIANQNLDGSGVQPCRGRSTWRPGLTCGCSSCRRLMHWCDSTSTGAFSCGCITSSCTSTGITSTGITSSSITSSGPRTLGHLLGSLRTDRGASHHCESYCTSSAGS